MLTFHCKICIFFTFITYNFLVLTMILQNYIFCNYNNFMLFTTINNGIKLIFPKKFICFTILIQRAARKVEERGGKSRQGINLLKGKGQIASMFFEQRVMYHPIN
jgi:hypothetical protein